MQKFRCIEAAKDKDRFEQTVNNKACKFQSGLE